MFQALIKYLLSKLAGITAEQWTTAVTWVLRAATDYKSLTGAEKKERVLGVLSKQWPELSGWVGNLLIEVAVAFTRK